MSQRLVELDSQVKAGGGTVVRMDKRTICSCCQQSRPPGYMLTRVGKVGRFCAHCVGERWVKSLPPEAESWSPEHVCRLLTGDASERVMGISAVLGYSEETSIVRPLQRADASVGQEYFSARDPARLCGLPGADLAGQHGSLPRHHRDAGCDPRADHRGAYHRHLSPISRPNDQSCGDDDWQHPAGIGQED